MAGSQTNMYKKQKRELTKTLTREGMFISEYVQCKYKDIYREAGMLYNKINKKYPRKPDLRKTVDFRLWRNSVATANGDRTTYVPREKEYKYKRTNHRDIILEATTETAAETPSESPVSPNQTDTRINGMTMCLNIPLMEIPHNNSSEQSVIEEGDQIPPPSEEFDQTLDPSVLDQIPSEGDQIPPPSEEFVFDQTLDPSVLDQIPSETVERIIQELQQDPNLKDLMDDVLNTINTEEEIVGLEIDLPELDDPLEEELELW